MRIIIFGAGRWGRQCLAYFIDHTEKYQIVGLWDNNPATHGRIRVKNIEVLVTPPSPEYTDVSFDRILIAVQSRKQISQIQKQLLELHIPLEKLEVFLDSSFFEQVMSKYIPVDEKEDRRIGWLREFANYVEENKLVGNTAECGVYRGDFAFFINKYFPQKMVYLFDSFQSFSKNDLNTERRFGDENFLSSYLNTSSPELFKTSVNLVREKMLFPEKCIIKEGYVPETFKGIEDKFCFVNLDMDLYQPMIAAMNFFYPKMVVGGVILLHDYFNKTLAGVRRAVHDFEKKEGRVAKVPIGDGLSLAIIKG